MTLSYFLRVRSASVIASVPAAPSLIAIGARKLGSCSNFKNTWRTLNGTSSCVHTAMSRFYVRAPNFLLSMHIHTHLQCTEKSEL